VNSGDTISAHSYFAGSENYVVPGIFKSEDYDYNCDVWQLGVLLYELIENK
jgi:serine/threonine protein kinase